MWQQLDVAKGRWQSHRHIEAREKGVETVKIQLFQILAPVQVSRHFPIQRLWRKEAGSEDVHQDWVHDFYVSPWSTTTWLVESFPSILPSCPCQVSETDPSRSTDKEGDDLVRRVPCPRCQFHQCVQQQPGRSFSARTCLLHRER